jgi:hypothetical protein
MLPRLLGVAVSAFVASLSAWALLLWLYLSAKRWAPAPEPE